MSETFEIEGQEFHALHGGPQFTFSSTMSLFVSCEIQEEVDELWEKLSAGGQKNRCGWLTDEFGLSWQIKPSVLGQFLGDKDAEKSQRVMKGHASNGQKRLKAGLRSKLTAAHQRAL